IPDFNFIVPTKLAKTLTGIREKPKGFNRGTNNTTRNTVNKALKGPTLCLCCPSPSTGHRNLCRINTGTPESFITFIHINT
ncbi:MAG TPA: hypothetical protein PLY33_12645, partial [Saprospiraceae bacterium]|nr:hypothetical protein [Saprospiraceae bacterium]